MNVKRVAYSLPMKLLGAFLAVAALAVAGAFASVACVAYFYGFYHISTASGAGYGESMLSLRGWGYLSTWQYEDITSGDSEELFQFIFYNRYSAIAIAAVALAAFFVLFVYLMCAAGRRGNRKEAVLGPLDRIPFDVVLAAAVFAVVLIFVAISEVSGTADFVILISAALLILAAVIVIYVLYTFAARVKAGRWWKNTVVFMCLHLVFVLLRYLWRGALRLFHTLRFEWRAGIAVAAFFLVNLVGFNWFLHWVNRELGAVVLVPVWGVAFCAAVFAANQFRKLRAAGEKLAAGELDYKVETSRMYFDFRRLGEDLNSIADGMSAAVEQRMRSERMKTELITNVSHDIKTPLTSIINYVDLLQKPHTPEEGEQYLEVLKRQSDRLRRLTLDLVEASKASTGSLPTEIVPTNSEELIDQAVAEYADRFAQGRLEPVITMPERPITVLADGRHLWRVLDNLFNNAVKYAQPGTRVYIDARRLDGGAVISVKNISRDRLNIPAEELMERFVRGDESRHTEGSGLGLSIARSLTELMGGTFNLVVDGDLFKAEIYLKVV